jgi:hypothetical protein
MLTTKYRVRVVNETFIDAINDKEVQQIAEILESRNAIPSFLGNISVTYSEIHQLGEKNDN